MDREEIRELNERTAQLRELTLKAQQIRAEKCLICEKCGKEIAYVEGYESLRCKQDSGYFIAVTRRSK